MSYLQLLAFGARMQARSRLKRQRLTVGISLFLVLVQLLSAVGMASLAILQPPAMAGLLGSPRAAFAAANVSGYVFRDFDSDGSKDTNETYGLANVTVNAYNSAGTVVATATSTAPAGAYTLNLSALANDTPLRIEFTNVASGYQSSFQGGTNVQFVTTSASALTINYAVNQPCDFCQAVPNLAVSRYNNGNPLLSPTGTAATLPALLKFPYNSSSATTPSTITTGNKIGAIWGLAYQRSSRKLFASAIQRRHVGFGPLGTGGLYMIDTTTNAVTNFMDINALPGVDTGTDPHVGLPDGNVVPSNDAASFDAVGKVALGDVEISDDEKTLWVTNLKDRTLLEIPIGNPPVAPTTVGSGANDVKVHPLPTPTCTSGLFRAWAVEFNEGKVFIGGLCTAESGGTQANMTAYVYSHLPTAAVGSFTLVTSFALNYARGCAFDTNGASAGGASDCDGWEVWQSNWAVPEAPVSSTPAGAPFSFWSKPQPIFSDLEFDDDGSLIIGMLDRWGLQTGANNYATAGTTLYNGTTSADLLRICNVSGSYQFQGTGSCPAPNVETSNAAINEHYKDPGPLSAPFHPESTHGALAFKPGSGEVATTFLDAFSTWRQSVVWFTNASGAPQTTHGVDIVTASNGGTSGAQGKATGSGRHGAIVRSGTDPGGQSGLEG
ncbi:MAG: SdrD B-like domain-containing protein [Candidatus Nanopelagicales bacterium]